MDPINCQACGRQNTGQSKFCQYCGTALSTTALAAESASSPPQPMPEASAAVASTNLEASAEPVTQGSNTPLPAETRLRDRYVIKHQLGQGGFGRTYLAEDTGRFNSPIVLKELTPAVQGTYALKKAEELFQREAETLHRLDHPQIPRFWEIFQAHKRLFLVEDCVVGQTYQGIAKERQQQGQFFSEVEMVQLFQNLLPVLVYLHGEGIIHRDISPDNIMRRNKDGLPVLIDLGGVKQIALDIATQMAEQQSGGGSTGGTRLGKVGYAPDEQMRLGLVAPHSDLYALAVTGLVLMTGKPPQELQDPNSLEWVWPQQLSLNPGFTQVLTRMLGPRPIDRYQSAAEVLQALSTVPPTQVDTPIPAATIPATIPVAPTPVPPATVPATAPVGPPATVVPQTHALGASNTSGQGTNSIVPDEIKGWNWGAFFLPGLWCLTNQVWLGLLAWPGLLLCGLGWPVMGIVLGASGNEWAWRNRPWRSADEFKAHQRGWAIGGLISAGLLTLMGMAIAVSEIDGDTASDDPPEEQVTEGQTTEEPTVQAQSSPTETPTSTESFDFQAIRIGTLETYTHDPPVFSLQVPERWELTDNSSAGELIIVWDDPTGNGRLVADIFDDTRQPTQDQLTEQLQGFLKKTYSDKPGFFLDDPQPQKDGSVRLVWGYTGTATGDIKIPLLGNSFIERKGDRIAVLTFIVPNAQFKDLQPSLNKIINNYTIDTTVPIPN